jgi:hypothetical protein
MRRLGPLTTRSVGHSPPTPHRGHHDAACTAPTSLMLWAETTGFSVVSSECQLRHTDECQPRPPRRSLRSTEATHARQAGPLPPAMHGRQARSGGTALPTPGLGPGGRHSHQTLYPIPQTRPHHRRSILPPSTDSSQARQPGTDTSGLPASKYSLPQPSQQLTLVNTHLDPSIHRFFNNRKFTTPEGHPQRPPAHPGLQPPPLSLPPPSIHSGRAHRTRMHAPKSIPEGIPCSNLASSQPKPRHPGDGPAPMPRPFPGCSTGT